MAGLVSLFVLRMSLSKLRRVKYVLNFPDAVWRLCTYIRNAVYMLFEMRVNYSIYVVRLSITPSVMVFER